MLQRKDFTSPEWKSLQVAIHGSAEYISLTQKSLFDGIFEMKIVDKILKEKQEQGLSTFIDDLIKYPEDLEMLNSIERSADTMEAVVIQSLKDSVLALQKRDVVELDIFRELVIEICTDIAEKFNGVSNEESTAYSKIKEALKDPPIIEEKLF